MRCWRRLLKSPLDSKEIQPVHPKGKSTLNVHWKDGCWSWKLQYFGHLMWRADSLVPTLLMRKTEGRRRRGRQKMRRLDSITASIDMNWSKLQETVKEAEEYVFVCSPTSLHKALAVPEPGLKPRKGASLASVWPIVCPCGAGSFSESTNSVFCFQQLLPGSWA